MDIMILHPEQDYYFHDNGATALGLQVMGCGYIEKKAPGQVITNRVLDSFGLVVIASGAGFFESRSVCRRDVCAGNAMMYFPGEWHSQGPHQGTRWEEYWFLFDGVLARLMHKNGLISEDRAVLQASDPAAVVETIKRALRIAHAGGRQRARLPGFLFEVLTDVSSSREIFASSPVQGPIDRIAQEIIENPQDRYSFEQLAVQNGLSYVYFRKEFRRLKGVSPYRFLLGERVRLAKQYLSEGLSAWPIRITSRVCSGITRASRPGHLPI
jgi:AraC-like DNA-binding protein